MIKAYMIQDLVDKLKIVRQMPPNRKARRAKASILGRIKRRVSGARLRTALDARKRAAAEAAKAAKAAK